MAAGVYLLDDLLPQTLGAFNVTTCQVGVRVLSAQTVNKGANMSSDAAYILARNLLAARLNQDAGACVAPQTFPYHGATLTFEQLLTASDNLLIGVGYNGTGSYLGTKVDKSLLTVRTDATYLAGIIDDYNNSRLCTGTPSH